MFKTCLAQFASCVNSKTVQILNNHKNKIIMRGKKGESVYIATGKIFLKKVESSSRGTQHHLFHNQNNFPDNT